ncbi:hypothetical protein HAX54_028345 [Datura stramonium]|uniref:Uncharacterized protein n=1 Tax=Datura stramonium TaxID=4076 RepID=A0ABS8V4T4_DATST|nr:hypothetical protein [Datura stramonium]
MRLEENNRFMRYSSGRMCSKAKERYLVDLPDHEDHVDDGPTSLEEEHFVDIESSCLDSRRSFYDFFPYLVFDPGFVIRRLFGTATWHCASFESLASRLVISIWIALFRPIRPSLANGDDTLDELG